MFKNKKILVIGSSLLVALAAVFSSYVIQTTPADEGLASVQGGGQTEDKITICHSGNGKNFTVNEVDNNSTYGGHGDHAFDIIPIGDFNNDGKIDKSDCEQKSLCGNGILNNLEQCDDGNLTPGDGCNEFCKEETVNPICGNGLIEDGEQCDDGNSSNGDGCSSICTTETQPPTPVCGDGTLDNGEQCDDGNVEEGDGCDSSCNEEAKWKICHYEGSEVYNVIEISVNAHGHDGHLNDVIPVLDFNEDGVINEDDCIITPPTPVCGNEQLESGEECDDGNQTPGDGCSSTCTIETPTPVCGDGNVDQGEECDDGNQTPGDGCDATCQEEKKIKICHSLDGEKYEINEVSVNAHGHDGHQYDIIPITDLNHDGEITESDCTYFPPIPHADLYLTKIDEHDPIVAGETETYSIRVFNDGPDASTGYSVIDNLPSGVTFVSATSADGTCNESSGVVTCEMDGLAVDGEADITITVTIDSQTSGIITNSVDIEGGNENDPDTNNNSDEEQTTVVAPGEIGSSKVDNDGDNWVLRGQPIIYTITLVNNSEDTVNNVEVYDELDSNLTYLQVLSVQGCGEYTNDSTLDPAVLDIKNISILPVSVQNPACVIQFSAQVVPYARQRAIIPNEATITFEEGPAQHPSSDDLIVRVGGGGGGGETGCTGASCQPLSLAAPELAPTETCLEYNPDRVIDYLDNTDIWTKDYVDFLSRVYLTDKNQFIISGDGSLYGDFSATNNTTIRPMSLTNRFETAKIALTSFCIPIYTNEERLAAGELEGARPDFPDLPRINDMRNPYRNGHSMNLDTDTLDFILNVMYTVYDDGILDGRGKPNGKNMAEWDQKATRAEILKVMVNAADYDTKNRVMYTQEELQEFADFFNTTVEALTPDQVLRAAIHKWGNYFYDVSPKSWYAQYIPMVVKNKIVADVCLPKNTVQAPGFEFTELNIRTRASLYNCSDLVDPARFAFPNNPAVRGEVLALDARMLWLQAATDNINSHSGRNMRNQPLLDVLFNNLQFNERSEFLFAVKFLLAALDNRG